MLSAMFSCNYYGFFRNEWRIFRLDYLAVDTTTKQKNVSLELPEEEEQEQEEEEAFWGRLDGRRIDPLFLVYLRLLFIRYRRTPELPQSSENPVC